MQLRMWTYDLAREQAPTLDHLRDICRLTVESGYNALGLYLEHRFAYPSTPWSHGIGAVTPEMVETLQDEFPQIMLVPFVNLLGHFEGMIYTEYGKQFREARFQGLQACACNEGFVELCHQILQDTVRIFKSPLIHIGGDETAQLGQCEKCAAKVAAAESVDGVDGKAALYGEHFGPLARWLVEQGRRPGIWGDMFADHPTALDLIPKETLIFDWQYFNGVGESAKKFVQKGFEVVGCPALHTYNATWLHLQQSEENVREVANDALHMNLHGVCVTTWECALFGSYDTLFPALRASGDILSGNGSGGFLEAYTGVSERHGEWADLMGNSLQSAGGTFAFGRIRSSLKTRLLLMANPFLAWMHHSDEFCGEVGDKALEIIERATFAAPDEATKGITLFARRGIEFVRIAEKARLQYAEGNFEQAIGTLSVTRSIFDELENVARRTHARVGGSLADIQRCIQARRHIEVVIQRIRHFGDGSLGYLPAFEIITHPKFMPHDQASWWLINKWANE